MCDSCWLIVWMILSHLGIEKDSGQKIITEDLGIF